MEHRIVEELPEEAEQKTEKHECIGKPNTQNYLKWHKPSHIAGNIDFSKGYSRVKFFLMDKLLKKKN